MLAELPDVGEKSVRFTRYSLVVTSTRFKKYLYLIGGQVDVSIKLESYFEGGAASQNELGVAFQSGHMVQVGVVRLTIFSQPQVNALQLQGIVASLALVDGWWVVQETGETENWQRGFKRQKE